MRKYLAAAALAILAGAANALPVTLFYADTVSGTADLAGSNSGDPFTMALVLDNGGTGVEDQTFTAADFVRISVTAGSYTAEATMLTGGSGSFTTDGAGNVASTPDSEWEVAGLDSLGHTYFEFYMNGFNNVWYHITPDGSQTGDRIGALNPPSASNLAVSYKDAAQVPLPASALLLVGGLLGLGLLRRKTA